MRMAYCCGTCECALFYHSIHSQNPLTLHGGCKVSSQVGFGEAKSPQMILSGGCGAAKPHHNHQRKECARVCDPRAPDFATAMVDTYPSLTPPNRYARIIRTSARRSCSPGMEEIARANQRRYHRYAAEDRPAALDPRMAPLYRSLSVGSTTPSRVVLHHMFSPTVDQWAGLRSMQGIQRFYVQKGWTSEHMTAYIV